MKICWDNLENIHLTVHGNFRKGKHTFKGEAENVCPNCSSMFLKTYNGQMYCSKSCFRTVNNKINNPLFKKNVRKKQSKRQMGSNNPAWKGGISLINLSERNILKKKPEYINWRKSVFERDNFTCRRCDQVGSELNAHHIYSWKDFPLLRYEIWNGFTLCIACHNYVHSKENKNNEYLKVA